MCVCVCVCVCGVGVWQLHLGPAADSHMPTLGELCATHSAEARKQRNEEGMLYKAGLIFWIKKTPYV